MCLVFVLMLYSVHVYFVLGIKCFMYKRNVFCRPT